MSIRQLTNAIVDQRLLDGKRSIKRVGDYVNNYTKIEWCCLVCKYVWQAKACHILANRGCPQCSDRIKSSNEMVDQELLSGNRAIVRIGEYINNRTPIEWECLDCKYIWKAVPHSILNRNVGCPSCAGTVRLTDADIDRRLLETNKKVKRVGSYINYESRIKWICLECNEVWETTPHSIFLSKEGCPKCNVLGVNEKIMHNILREHNIRYEPQFYIRNINPIAPLYRLDAFLSLEKVAIEYNGRQHYEMSPLFGDRNPELSFRKQQERDQFVRDFCIAYNIRLIEIDGRTFYGKALKNHLINAIIPSLSVFG